MVAIFKKKKKLTTRCLPEFIAGILDASMDAHICMFKSAVAEIKHKE